MKSYQRLVSVGWPLLALGCGASESSKQSGYASSKDDRWRSRSISVCFTQVSPAIETAKDIITEGINTEFGKVGLSFNVSRDCSEGAAISVRFVNSGSSAVDKIGSSAQTVSLGVGHSCADSAGNPVSFLTSNCLRNVAVHEFGHIVGLHHEMNRRDNDQNCTLDQTSGLGEPGTIQLGDYDSSSIMNYCHLFRKKCSQ